MLNPKIDLTIDKFALDDAAEKISLLLEKYDEYWIKAFSNLKIGQAQLENLENEIKDLKGRISFEIKNNWINYDFDKSPSDKVCENYVFTTDEYKEIIKKLAQKKEEIARLASIEHKHKLYHYQLLVKKEKITELYKMWCDGYYCDIDGKRQNNQSLTRRNN